MHLVVVEAKKNQLFPNN